MPRGIEINAIPTVQILLQYGYPKMSGHDHQPTCHICRAMLMKLDMIFSSYSKFLVNFVRKGSYMKLSGHGCV